MAEVRLTHEDIFEAYDDSLGSWMGILIDGHVDDETAVALMWAIQQERLDDGDDDACDPITPPKRCWLWKVPRDGFMTYHYADQPARGAKPVTRVEVTSRWAYRCDLPGCENHYVKGGASMGFPIENFIDPPEPRQVDRYVYMCRRHARSFDDRLAEARREALAKLQAERAD